MSRRSLRCRAARDAREPQTTPARPATPSGTRGTNCPAVTLHENGRADSHLSKRRLVMSNYAEPPTPPRELWALWTFSITPATCPHPPHAGAALPTGRQSRHPDTHTQSRQPIRNPKPLNPSENPPALTAATKLIPRQQKRLSSPHTTSCPK